MTGINVTATFKEKDTDVTEGLVKGLEAVMIRMESHAVRIAPVITGNLRNMIRLEKINDFLWKLISAADYSVPVEFGTSPHIIRPRTKKALKFKSGGKTVFAKRVKHPGTSGSPYMRPAKSITEQEMSQILAQFL